METLGHSQISVTMDVYGHVMPAAQRDAAHLMDAALSGEKEGPDDGEGTVPARMPRRPLLSPLLSGAAMAVPKEQDRG